MRPTGALGRARAGRYLRSTAARRAQGVPRARRSRSSQMHLAYAVVRLAPAAYLALLAGTGAPLPAGSAVLALVGLLLGRHPDSVLSTGVWVVLGGLWFALAAPHGLVLLAAVVALLGHCATAYVAGAPSDAQVEPALLRRWAGRVLVVVAVTTAVWALAQLLSAANLPGSVALTTAALVGLGGWVLLVRGGDASDR